MGWIKGEKDMNTFDNVSGQYKEKAIIQNTAASNLLSLIEIRKSDSIIDIACGPGHITCRLNKITTRKIPGFTFLQRGITRASLKKILFFSPLVISQARLLIIYRSLIAGGTKWISLKK